MRRLVGAVDAPIVQLWGWAGTGKRAVIASLVEDEHACFLTRAQCRSEADVAESLERARSGGQRCFAMTHCEQEAVARVSARLCPGEFVLFAAEERMELGAEGYVVDPTEWLLRSEEVAELWLAETGRELGAARAEALRQASEGWLSVLELWARQGLAPELGNREQERVAARTIATLLETRVLSSLSPSELRALGALAGGLRAESSPEDLEEKAGTAVLAALRLRVGLPMLEQGCMRLPRPLALVLDRQRREGSLDRRARPSATPSAPDVTIRLLGVPRVEHRAPDGEPHQVGFSFRRPLQVLAFLAMAPGYEAPREELVEAVWPDATEAAIRRNFHPTVSLLRRHLRSAVGEAFAVVVAENGTYRLDPELRWRVDARVFEDERNAGREHRDAGLLEEAARRWRQAWAVYEGPFMQGFHGPWVASRRELLHVAYMGLLRDLGSLFLELERWVDAEDALRRLLLEDPLEEGVYALLMTAYARRGRRDLVNRQFERLRKILLSELGVEPSSATLAVYNELMV
jgi:DNA-binding SARP family transcriptional activator